MATPERVSLHKLTIVHAMVLLGKLLDAEAEVDRLQRRVSMLEGQERKRRRQGIVLPPSPLVLSAPTKTRLLAVSETDSD